MSPPILEVIATSVPDAVAAERGGADRLEVVSAMEADGLLPDLDVVRRLRDTVVLPLRVMLRLRPDFSAGTGVMAVVSHASVVMADGPDLEALCRAAGRLRAAGVDQFVYGFLTTGGSLDLDAMHTLYTAAAPAGWTLHRAFDHAADAATAFAACARLPGLDRILSSGSPYDLDAGLSALCARATWQTPMLRWIAGGGLRLEHIAPLRQAGITEFHTGRAVRHSHSWDAPVDEPLVRRLKEAVTGESVLPLGHDGA
ncbi:MAG: hypothetical protein AVDCRST_MAG77-2740 [uncultured Chloroflexi bacterium]|uniref:Copper homeostasis protein cutC homolog n=1 Tax=uncultured Chloroflexota bacterium TaxID=166587 RepID=A0A6J4IZ62_9CHLR|nr:MAG: hypothetical protein AVDCRST_MAG77-2740 [uncultured Chloroflexota bacterium]